jgi:hypothetical protein
VAGAVLRAPVERISIKDGAVEQSNFYDYIVPRNHDVPPMQVEVIQTDNHPTGIFLICVFISGLPRRALNRSHDTLIGAAAA